MTILVTGATGNVGRPLVDLLLAAGQPVRATSRRPETAGLPAEVDVRGGDLSQPDSVSAAFDGVERLFLLSDWDTAGLLDRAKRAGVRRVVTLSSVGAQLTDQAFWDGHREFEQVVQASGLPWTHIQPGMFTTNLLQWSEQIRAHGVVREPYAGAGADPVHPLDIADLAFEALTTEGLEGVRRPVVGPQVLTKPEMVAAIGQGIGRELRFEEISVEQFRAETSLPEFIVDAMLRLWQQMAEGTLGEFRAERGTRTVRDWAAENAEAFR
ncbi:NAD-dependent epimerase/dehydratase family protein [Pseudonocardiaceae bacterium YIM PH 21723]|nr:NAD-dependent epimerase/dehydratase family protein [Pseudonocardiaceae bacterium YIM PH 21723]